MRKRMGYSDDVRRRCRRETDPEPNMWAVRNAEGQTVGIYADKDEASYYAARFGNGCYVAVVGR